MKAKAIIFLLIILYSNGLKSQKKLESFKLSCVQFGITTPYSISCKDFESSFPKETYSIKSYDDSVNVLKLYDALKYIRFNKGHVNSIDVRAKIYLNYSNPKSLDTLCLNKFYVLERNGKFAKATRELINILEELFKDCK